MCHGHLARESQHGQDGHGTRKRAAGILPVKANVARTFPDVFDRDGHGTNILAVIREGYFGNPKCNGIATE